MMDEARVLHLFLGAELHVAMALQKGIGGLLAISPEIHVTLARAYRDKESQWKLAVLKFLLNENRTGSLRTRAWELGHA